MSKVLTGCRLKVIITGYTTKEDYAKAKKAAPHMHPCPLEKGWWVYKKDCISCMYAKFEEKNI